MSLEGLRAWIGEVERKLAKRTRVFLVLTVIAIGLAGAAIYLALDARESSVSEGDVQALQQQLETRIDELATTTSSPPAAEQAAPEADRKGAGEAPSGGTDGASSSPTGGAPSAAKLQEILQQAKERAGEGK
jgi:hypothetical protein